MAGAGYKLFNAGDVLSASDVNTYMMQQTVMVFANASARTTALSSVLAEGMVSYLQDTNSLEVYDGSAWVGATGDITGLTAGTGVAITSPSGPVPTVAIDTAVVPQLSAVNTFTGQNIINAAGTTTVDLIVRATASQTADLQQWQSSTSAIWGAIRSNGRFDAYQASYVSTGAAATVGLIVQGAASQTADLQQWQNSGGTTIARVTSAGNIATPIVGSLTAGHAFIQTAGASNAIQVQTNAAANIGLIVIGAASQTANLQEWRNSAGTVLNRVSSDGRLIVGATDTAGSISINPDGASRIALRIRLAGSATAEAIRVDNSSGANLTSITAAGTINFVTGNTATTATAGAITPPSQVVGYITMQIAGTTVKVPYYAN